MGTCSLTRTGRTSSDLLLSATTITRPRHAAVNSGAHLYFRQVVRYGSKRGNHWRWLRHRPDRTPSGRTVGRVTDNRINKQPWPYEMQAYPAYAWSCRVSPTCKTSPRVREP